MCKVYTEYHGTSEIGHGLCACTVGNPLAKARGLSLRTGAKAMLYLSSRSGVNNIVAIVGVYFAGLTVFVTMRKQSSNNM